MERTFRRKVAFSETDASGRVHFTHLLKWAEEAEHQLLGQLGVSVFDHDSGWPRVSVSCDFKRPFSFGDEAEIILSLAEIGDTSLRWCFRILREQEVAAKGEMTTVWVEGGRPSSLPNELREKLKG